MVQALYKKEILDILRDKKTMLITVLVPLILYPLLFLGGLLAVSMVVSNQQSATYRVVFVDVSEQSAIESVMKEGEKERGYYFETVQDTGDWEQQLKKQNIDICILQKKKGKQIAYEIQYLSSVSAFATAASHMEEILSDYEKILQKKAVEKAGLDVQTVLHPITASKVDHSSKEESAGSIVGSILPFLLITSILMGAIYPAIDTTAGEKERGTLETLLTLPVTNLQLILSKFLAVSTVAVVSAILNLLSMMVFGGIFYHMLLLRSTADIAVNMVAFIPAILLLFLCVVVFALFISAVCLCICMFAKSFKEAQNYSTPLVLIVLIIGYIGFIPSISLDSIFAVLPVANIVLLIKNILSFQVNFGNICLVLFSNLAYSFLAVFLMSKMYNSESILFGEGGSVQIFEKRSNIKKGQMPGLGDAFLLLAISLLLYFYFGSYMLLRWGFMGVAMQQVMFFLLVAGFSWYMKVDWKRLFSVRLPQLSSLIGAILLWAGVYLAMLPLNDGIAKWFPESAASLEQTNQWFENQPFGILFLVVAVLPAICEEVLFRGFLYGTFREHWKSWVAILLSGLLFSVYHMNIVQLLAIWILGCVMAYSVHCSKSIFTSMTIHFCNNGLAVCMLAFPKSVQRMLPFLQISAEKAGVRTYLLLFDCAIFLAGIGIFLLKKGKK